MKSLIFSLRKAPNLKMQTQPVALSNNEIVMVEFPEKVYTVEQASNALQVPFDDEMQAIIDAKLLREQIKEAQTRLSQLELDQELARKEFNLVEKMVAASGFRPMRPSQEEGIMIPYAIHENLSKGVLVASVNGSKGSNTFIQSPGNRSSQ